MAKRLSKSSSEILDTLGDFTSKENWDKFFTLRGAGDSFEWYAEWPEIRGPLLEQLSTSSGTDAGVAPADLQFLVPGCGSSRLSEYLYDAGFRHITNIDFSKVVIHEMLRRYVRSRPEMRWRVMDMTNLQFSDELFDVILDKGGLDALMEPEHGAELGFKYLEEVKRVLRLKGKFLCFTLAESHVLHLLLSELRFGWETSIHAIPCKSDGKSTFQTFMVVAVKDNIGALGKIKLFFDESLPNGRGIQVQASLNAVAAENQVRDDYICGADIIFTLKDLKLGAKGDLSDLNPGRRVQFILSELGISNYHFKAVLLDAKQQSESFVYHCGVFIVPKVRANEWLFTSEEGQWVIVESSKSARLIMVFLDSSHDNVNMDDIQKYLSPLVKNLAPGKSQDKAQIPFMMANDGIKHRNVIHESTSSITGDIIVEDVIYETTEGLSPSGSRIFRRLIFGRSSGLVQSEAILSREPHSSDLGTDGNKSSMPSKPRKRNGQKRKDSGKSIDGFRSMKVDHSSLASLYHCGIVSGFTLVVSALESAISSGLKISTYIVGLGAGLLPMFLHNCFPFLEVEVMELDPLVLDLAREYFCFVEGQQMKVHIGDGIQFIQDASRAKSSLQIRHLSGDHSNSNGEQYDETCNETLGNGNISTGIRFVIIDADSADLSSGLSCPPSDFIEESFLLSVRDLLLDGGLFVINLVSRSQAVREKVVLQLQTVFSNLFSLELKEDVNEILFAIPSSTSLDDEHLPEAAVKLRSLMRIPFPEGQIESCKFKRLK